jgi:hypothetical protein
MTSKANIKYAGFVFGMILTLTMTTNSALAASTCDGGSACWQIGAEHTISGIVDINADVNTPPVPTSVTGTTLYWIGADTVQGTNKYLTQPELLAVPGDNKWRITLESVNYANGNDVNYYFSNMEYSSGKSMYMEDVVFPVGHVRAGQNFQDVEDLSVGFGASQYFNGVTYGNSFNKMYAELESYDFTGSHFSALNSHSISFTNYQSETTPGGTGTLQTLTATKWASSGTAPSCITSTAGSGTITISASGC